MKTIKSFNTEQEASIFALSLKELGIDSTIFKTDGGPYPGLSAIYGYSVSVNDDDFQNAIDHLPVFSPNNLEATQNINLPESNISDPVSKKGLVWGSLITGVFIGLIINWLYSSIHYKLDFHTKYYYHNGLISKIVKDRNRDNKFDLWQIYHSDNTVTIKEDNNFDGKVDWWWEDKGYGAGIEKIDIDSNEIPDMTYSFANDIVSKEFIHPDDINKKVIYREYSPLGVIEKEFVDSDSIPGFDILRNYDSLGKLIQNDKIKDTIIGQF
jgi:hypothetical protein